ncbi:uncharacterized protein LOC135818447 [Sycon ciliatum]|uniref:uncharacterized protein LOC135818447 n=1 Tax=Sycon ciliatum TaxID=27933 RepID=UPI0031F6D4E7|eukprot:scpid92975/ scgid20251/ 
MTMAASPTVVGCTGAGARMGRRAASAINSRHGKVTKRRCAVAVRHPAVKAICICILMVIPSVMNVTAGGDRLNYTFAVSGNVVLRFSSPSDSSRVCSDISMVTLAARADLNSTTIEISMNVTGVTQTTHRVGMVVFNNQTDPCERSAGGFSEDTYHEDGNAHNLCKGNTPGCSVEVSFNRSWDVLLASYLCFLVSADIEDNPDPTLHHCIQFNSTTTVSSSLEVSPGASVQTLAAAAATAGTHASNTTATAAMFTSNSAASSILVSPVLCVCGVLLQLHALLL